MRAVPVMLESRMRLRKALLYSGCLRKLYCHREPIPPVIGLDLSVVDAVQGIALRRSSYGPRRMAVMLSRELGRHVNRKQVQRAYRS